MGAEPAFRCRSDPSPLVSARSHSTNSMTMEPAGVSASRMETLLTTPASLRSGSLVRGDDLLSLGELQEHLPAMLGDRLGTSQAVAKLGGL